MGSFLDVLMRNEHMDMSRSLAHEGRPREQRNDTNFTTLPTVEQWDRCTYAVGLLCLSLESGVTDRSAGASALYAVRSGVFTIPIRRTCKTYSEIHFMTHAGHRLVCLADLHGGASSAPPARARLRAKLRQIIPRVPGLSCGYIRSWFPVERPIGD